MNDETLKKKVAKKKANKKKRSKKKRMTKKKVTRRIVANPNFSVVSFNGDFNAIQAKGFMSKITLADIFVLNTNRRKAMKEAENNAFTGKPTLVLQGENPYCVFF